MTYRLAKTAPDELLILPQSVLDKVEEAGLTETRVLLCAAALLTRGALSEEALLEALGERFSREDAKAALAFWRGVGVLENASSKGKRAPAALPPESEERDAPEKIMPDPDVPPFYSGQDLEKAAKNHPDYKHLVEFVEKRLDKVLNTGELASIWSWLDYVKMPCDVLMLIIEDCCARGHGNMRYITKAVMRFQDEGLTSYEKAEAYYLKQTKKEKFARRIKKLFGMGDRALTKAEDGHLTEWMAWDFSEEMLDLAYEKTVAAASKPSINYMHKILLSWHEAKAATPRDVEDLSRAKPQAYGQKGEKSYDLDAAFEKAEARQRKGL